MKTSDEAMGMFMNRVALDETPDKAREMEQRLVDNMLKYREIQREVRDNPRIDILTQLLVMLAVENNMCAHQIIAVAFSQGVCVGIEMEKADI